MGRRLGKMRWLLVLVVLTGSMERMAGAQEASALAGTVTVTATSVAAGIGWT